MGVEPQVAFEQSLDKQVSASIENSLSYVLQMGQVKLDFDFSFTALHLVPRLYPVS